MLRCPKEVWFSGLLILALAGCGLLSEPIPPPRVPRVSVQRSGEPGPTARKPPEAAPSVPAAPLIAQAEPEGAPAPPAPEAPQPGAQPKAPEAQAPQPRPAVERGRFVVFNFDNADIDVVIQAASEMLGFNYVLEPEVRGKKVTVKTSGRVAREDVFDVLLAILEVHGVTAVKSGQIYKILRIEGARERSVPTVIGTEPDTARVGDEIITQIIPLRFASEAQLMTPLRPLISARGSLISHREKNVLIVTDSASNVQRILDIVKLIDVSTYVERRIFIYLAENAKAKDLAATMNAIYGLADAGARAPRTTPSPGRPAGATPEAPPAPPAAPPAPPAAAAAGPPAGLLEGDVRFIADETSNAVIVTASSRDWPEIEQTLKTLDRMPRQVLIEVLVVEITLDAQTSLGIEWALREGRFDLIQTQSGSLSTRPGFSIPPAAAITGLPGGLTAFTFETGRFFALLRALASENKLNVLSNPSIMTSENKKAVINVSQSVPIATSQQVPVTTAGVVTGTSITQNIEFRDVGIILTVTPRIGDQGTVALDIKQEVNEVGATEPPPVNVPRFIKREAETSVVLMNNQTLVMGGLIQTRRELVRAGVPLLYKIPIIGYLFGTVEQNTSRTDLLLLITPRVLGTALDAARITEQMRRITPEMQEAIRLAPRPPSAAPPPPAPGPPAPRQLPGP